MGQGRSRPSTLLYAPFSQCSSSGQHNGADLPETRLMRLLVVLAGVAAVLSFAATARADPSGSDATFIAALNNARITYHNAPDAVAIGRRACELMDQGQAGGRGHQEHDAGESGTHGRHRHPIHPHRGKRVLPPACQRTTAAGTGGAALLPMAATAIAVARTKPLFAGLINPAGPKQS
jgi:hypothetical protein